jgi:L-fucose mutarotase
MLKGINKIISPELLKILCEMGHGDEIVIADGNFPGESHGGKVVRMDGHGVVDTLSAILELFPLDTYAAPVFLMAKAPGDAAQTPIWDDISRAVRGCSDADIGFEERFAFYERAKRAYAIVMTGESALYANVLLKKGVVS